MHYAAIFVGRVVRQLVRSLENARAAWCRALQARGVVTFFSVAYAMEFFFFFKLPQEALALVSTATARMAVCIIANSPELFVKFTDLSSFYVLTNIALIK